MSYSHDYLSLLPFDIYDLTLFGLVAEAGSFTAAGTQMGLTQSAITRRIAAMEGKLGLRLFERTTRRVLLTPAGTDLLARVRPLITEVSTIASSFLADHGVRRPELRVSVARSIGLAYLPGFFFAFQREFSDVQIHVSQQNGTDILQALDAGTLDAGLICPPRSLPRSLTATHRFTDDFTLIVPPKFPAPPALTISQAKKLLGGERWLLIDPKETTGIALKRWLDSHEWKIDVAMELDSFDMIANLVSLGLGVALVPHRVLPLYEKRRAVKRVRLKQRFQRELAVVVRKQRRHPEHLQGFIRSVLF